MTKRDTSTQFALGLFFLLGISGTVLAQTTRGTIHGAVLDSSGALIAHAQVTVSDADGFERTIRSDDAGAFEMGKLAPGSYSVSVEAAGFTPTLEGVRVVADRVTEETVRMGISVNQEIEVLANL
jgi:hypothetical protein